MNEKVLKMWLMGFLTKYGMSEPSKEVADKLNKDADQILTFIKQHYNLREKEQDENHHQAEPS